MPKNSKVADAGRPDAVPVSRYVLFFGIAIAGCAVDLLTKHWIFARLGHQYTNEGFAEPPIWLIDGVFGFQTHLNEGALFGLGQGQVALFAVLSVIAATGVVVWLFVMRAAHDLLLTLALGSVTGGIFGNLYDRLGFTGLTWASGLQNHKAGERVYAVRDWLHFKIDAIGFDWPIFNIADCLLVVGAGMLIWHALVQRGNETGETTAKPQEASD